MDSRKFFGVEHSARRNAPSDSSHSKNICENLRDRARCGEIICWILWISGEGTRAIGGMFPAWALQGYSAGLSVEVSKTGHFRIPCGGSPSAGTGFGDPGGSRVENKPQPPMIRRSRAHARVAMAMRLWPARLCPSWAGRASTR